MSRRNRLFGVIVAVVFAGQFTLAALNQVFWLFQTSADGSMWLEDPNTWVHLAFSAVLAVILWAVAVRLWKRYEPHPFDI